MKKNKCPSIVAIDGPAGSGKTTLARALAGRLNFAMVDTGAIYRSAAFLAERKEISLEDEESLAELVTGLDISFQIDESVHRVFLGSEEITEKIRRHEISAAASKLSSWPKVRSGLLDLQRRLALDARRTGAVLEGRDIGTVVFPDADVKIFVTATPEERAKRRYEELKKKGFDVSWEQIAKDQAARDEQDSTRDVAPLKPAPDAIVFDSTGMEVLEVIDKLEHMINELLEKKCA